MFLYVVLFWIALPVVVAAAFRWGGRPEQAGALLYLGAAVLTLAVRPYWQGRYHSVETGVLAIDVALVFGLAAIAYRTELWWPIISAALQTVSTLAHIAKIINPGFWRLAYAVMSGASSYPTLLMLAIGIWGHRRRTSSRTSPR